MWHEWDSGTGETPVIHGQDAHATYGLWAQGVLPVPYFFLSVYIKSVSFMSLQCFASTNRDKWPTFSVATIPFTSSA
ncbi:MAG: hypothetical protein ACRD4L_09075 [Pyrinomonadaceae bacterium]